MDSRLPSNNSTNCRRTSVEKIGLRAQPEPGPDTSTHLSSFFIKLGPSPASFSFIFGLFQTFFQLINVKKCPSSNGAGI